MEENKKSKKKVILISALIIVLVAVIAALGIILYNVLNKEPEDRRASAGLVTNKTKEELAANPDNMFTTDMNMKWSFPNGNVASSDAYVGNSENNKRDCYFDVFLADDPTQELIYQSPVMKPGEHLEELALDKPLAKGKYAAVTTFHLVDDNGTEVSKVSFNVVITVLN